MGYGGAQIWVGLILTLTAEAAAAACVPDAVELRGPAGTARFHVEIADDPAEMALGLMNRPSMAASAGMLFVYPAPKHAMFWMKDTLIPLDMLFMDAAGRVTHVHPMAKPLDTTPIDGGEGVTYVLEINGGLAARLGLAEGAEMRHPRVDPALAAWPCD